MIASLVLLPFEQSILLFDVSYDMNSFPAGGNLCSILIICANSSDTDQARQNVGPDLDPNC